MPKTKSKLSLSERREQAFAYFARGYTNTEIAKRLKVSHDTVAGYRKKYEENVHAAAAANPKFLSDVVTNTFRSLEELDRIREDAWKQLERRKITLDVECPSCGEPFATTIKGTVSDQQRVQYQNVLLKAQEQRAKLFGILGVKQEIFVAITNVKIVQDKVLEWMGANLCAEDREALGNFIETELAGFLGPMAPMAALDVPDSDIEEAEIVSSQAS